MTKRIRKAAIGKKTTDDKISSSITGDANMETMKSGETKQGSLKQKTNGSKAGRPKPGRLSVTDLKANTIMMTRKKADKPAVSVTKTAVPEVKEPRKSSKKAASKTAGKAKTNRKTAEKPVVSEKPGLKKQYVKEGKACKVTFRLPKEAAPDAGVVTVVGDFNNWNVTETKMKKLKNGDFTTTVELPCKREYRFRYLIDAKRWENDWCADKYIRNRYGSDDSVVII